MKSVTEKEKKVTIVVGGMHGIAKNISSLFFQKGHKVIIIDKDNNSNHESNFYDKNYICDLLNDKSCLSMFKKIKKELAKINNIIFCTRYRGDSDKSWDAEIKLQLTTPKKFLEELGFLLVKKDSSIIFMSSILSERVSLNTTVEYHVVTAGLESMTRYFAVKLGKNGTRVNAISPGYIIKDEIFGLFSK